MVPAWALVNKLCWVLYLTTLKYGEGNGNPLQYSCLENPMDGGSWKAAVHGVAEGQTWLSDFRFTFHFHALEKERATHSSVLAWRIPGMGEPAGLPSMGLHRVGHDWSDLAVAEPWSVDLYPRSQILQRKTSCGWKSCWEVKRHCPGVGVGTTADRSWVTSVTGVWSGQKEVWCTLDCGVVICY